MNKLLISCALLMTGTALAQTATRFDSSVTTTATNVPINAQAPVLTVPNAIVTVCAFPATGIPCTNTIPIYQDQGLTTQADNPLTTDPKGRFGFWLASGQYSYSVQNQQGQNVGNFSLSLGGSGGNGAPVGLGARQDSNISGSAFINEGIYNTQVYATGTNTGQGNFFNSANCIANGACAGVIPPTSPDTSAPGLGFSTSKLSSIVTDYRANSIAIVSFNPQLTFASAFDGGAQSVHFSQVDYTEASPSPIQGNTQALLSEEVLFGDPGFSNGLSGCPDYCPNAPHTSVAQWSLHNVHDLFTSYNGSGINNVNTKQTVFGGTGDSQDEADFDFYMGGCVAPSDECHHWQSVHIATAGDYGGVIATATGSTNFFVTTTANSSSQGQGRFLIGLNPVTGTDSTPLQNLIVSAITKPGDGGVPYGEVVFQASNIPSSTFQGVMATDCIVPVQEGGVATCTGSVTVTSGQLCAVGAWNGSSCVGSAPVIVCTALNTGNIFNFAQPISVTSPSGGAQNLTMSIHRTAEVGSVVFQGGMCGGYIATNESQVIANAVGVQGFPLIGSLGGSGVAYANYDASQVWAPIPNPGSSWGSRDTGNTQAAHGFSVVSLARHSNVVTGTNVTGFDSDKWKELGGAFDFNVSGCTSDPTLNSISVGAPIIYAGPDPSVGNPHAGQIAYSQTGPDTVTPCTAVIATQFTTATLFPAAEVYDVMNHAAAVVDGTFVTSYQPAFTVGVPVDSPTHYAAGVNGIQISGESGQPLLDNTNYTSISHGYSSLVGSGFFAQNFATNVMGSNGIQNPQNILQSDGLFDTGIFMGAAPPNNGSAIRIGSPSSLFANQNSSFRRYGLLQLDWVLNNARTQLLFDDDTQSYWWNYNFSQYPSVIFGPTLTNFAVQAGTNNNVPTQVGELRYAEFGSNGNTPFGPLFHVKQCAPLTPPSVTSICYSSFTPTNAVVTQGGTAGTTEYIYILQWNDVAGPAYGSPIFTFTGAATLSGSNFNSIPCSDMPTGTTGIIWEFNNSIGFQKVGTCSSPSTVLNDTGTYTQDVGPNGTIAGALQISGGFEATGLLGGYYFSQPEIYGTTTPALTRTAGITQTAAGQLSVDTTAQGNGLGTLKAAEFSGPAVAPSGACTVIGWAFSQDGHATFCNGTSWATKI